MAVPSRERLSLRQGAKRVTSSRRTAARLTVRAASARRRSCVRSFRNGHSDLVAERNKARIRIIGRKEWIRAKCRDQDGFAHVVSAFEPFEQLASFAAKRINARDAAWAALGRLFDQLLESSVGLLSLATGRARQRDSMDIT